jgi:hypothetical protein
LRLITIWVSLLLINCTREELIIHLTISLPEVGRIVAGGGGLGCKKKPASEPYLNTVSADWIFAPEMRLLE